jgi:hypothetical protein
MSAKKGGFGSSFTSMSHTGSKKKASGWVTSPKKKSSGHKLGGRRSKLF